MGVGAGGLGSWISSNVPGDSSAAYIVQHRSTGNRAEEILWTSDGLL